MKMLIHVAVMCDSSAAAGRDFPLDGCIVQLPAMPHGMLWAKNGLRALKNRVTFRTDRAGKSL